MFLGIIGGAIGYDLIVDSYNCYYGVSVFSKDIPDILTLVSAERLINYENYEMWVHTKIENALKLDLSAGAYELEKGLDLFNQKIIDFDSVKKTSDIAVENKNTFDVFKNNVWDNTDIANKQVVNNVDFMNINIREKTELDIKNFIDNSSDEYVDFSSGNTNVSTLDDDNDLI